MKCKFEEKQYEQHLNNELLMRQELLYVPGQVLEGQLGFDAAIYSENRHFWRLFDGPGFLWRRWIRNNRSGVQLSVDFWRELEQEVAYFPRFRFNIFVQHKRPEQLSVRTSREWEHWKQPYFRYSLTPHQQKALEQLETATQNNAVVVYASPAFITHEELWDAVAQRRLIETSNFCQPSKLVGHTVYSYIDPGNKGKGHSEPEDIESFSFYDRIRATFDLAEQFNDNREFLVQLGGVLLSSIQNCGDLSKSFNTILNGLTARYDDTFTTAMARISAFNYVVGTRWLVGIEPRR